MRRSNNSNGGREAAASRALVLINNNNNDNALVTVNAAANRIAFVENRLSRPSASTAVSQKRRWRGCWNIYWCFGYQRRRKRIGHAVFVPESLPAGSGNETTPAENHNQPAAAVLQFIAPPSSPASFLPSEPPSCTQSPAGLVTLSPSMYSPTGPTSIFAIGPYAHETQLVSPPALSTITTDPSTAPFTPPPESFRLNTTASSPEVPFAHWLDPRFQNGEFGHRFSSSHHDFSHYQFHPGSPAGQFTSPRSGISGSGASSPFPDGEFAAVGFPFMEFRVGDPRTQGSGTLTPDSSRLASSNFVLDRQSSDLGALPNMDGWRQNNQAANCRFFFEFTAGDRLTQLGREVVKLPSDPENHEEAPVTEKTYDEQEVPKHRRHRTITLGCVDDFDFENAEGEELNKQLDPEDRDLQQGSAISTTDCARLASSNFEQYRKSSDLGELLFLDGGHQNNQAGNHRLFFDLTAGNNLTQPEREMNLVSEPAHAFETRVGKTFSGTPEKASDVEREDDKQDIPTHRRHRTITFGCADDFNFESEKREDLDELAPQDPTPDSARPATSSNFVLGQKSSDLGDLPPLNGELQNNRVAYHTVYFEPTAGDPLGFEELKPAASCGKPVVESEENLKKTEREDSSVSEEVAHEVENRVGEASNGLVGKDPDPSALNENVDEEGPTHRRHRTITFGCAKDFEFEDAHKDNSEESNGSMVEKQGETDWSFFPIIQTATVS
ncbi:Uncharacterized protein At1g76660 [Linum perenne]